MPTRITEKPRPVTALIATAGLAMALNCHHVALAQGGGDPLAEPFPAVLEAASLDAMIGLRIVGMHDGERMGEGTAFVGDINGDGVDDLAMGAPSGSHYLGRKAGHTYVLFGPIRRAPYGVPASVRVDDVLADGHGFAIYGEGDYAFSGRNLARAGDINGDGLDDMLVSGERASPGGLSDAGEAYLIYGQADGGFPDILNINRLRADQGLRIPGVAARDLCGYSVAGNGDVNGDGITDIIVSAHAHDSGGVYNAGAAYVVFGGSGLPPVVDPAGLDGSNGFRIEGVIERGGLGGQVAIPGDLNGDGVDDLAVSATGVAVDGVEGCGVVYVVFGRRDGWPAVVSAANLGGQSGYRLEGRTRLARAGGALAAAGDFNGDGRDDLLIGSRGGSPGGRTYAGAAYVLYGRAADDPIPPVRALDDLDGISGIRLEGAVPGDAAGFAVAGIGDVNGDGLDDVLIGADRAAGEAGQSYVVFGRRFALGGSPASLPLSELDGLHGFRIDAIERGERSGHSVAGAGDINGDGRADLAIGAYRGGTRIRDSGDVYIVYGRDAACLPDLDGDGETTTADYLAFQNLFDAGDPAADFDGDGLLTIFDFLAYQNAFDLGCP